jgi:hypothetical protein
MPSDRAVNLYAGRDARTNERHYDTLFGLQFNSPDVKGGNPVATKAKSSQFQLAV